MTYHQTAVDLPALRRYRLDRIQAELKRRDLAGALLTDPVNIRYATDSVNMQVWALHNQVRFVYIATEGPMILFDFGRISEATKQLNLIDEIRPITATFYFLAGNRLAEKTGVWADEIADLVAGHGGGNRRIAVDKLEIEGVRALDARRIVLVDGQELMETARAIKSAEEIHAMREAIAVCEEGMRRMHAALEPGVTESYIWSLLCQANIELGGEWMEARLLTSGPRTFPWYQEAGNRVIEAGDIVSFDTDMIGPNGYCADISRAWVAGGRKPTTDQAWMLDLAREELAHNIAVTKPGMTFREVAEAAFKVPEKCMAHRYGGIAHGIGMADEWPPIYHADHFAESGVEGVIEPGMTLCFESLVGVDGGTESVKLEQQVVVTETGLELLSDYSLDEAT